MSNLIKALISTIGSYMPFDGGASGEAFRQIMSVEHKMLNIQTPKIQINRPRGSVKKRRRIALGKKQRQF